jgi:hypothetical protein
VQLDAATEVLGALTGSQPAGAGPGQKHSLWRIRL